ncbi:MAG: mechanosensitive ion channel family protein [bacterium]|nr:mechanosensitive ion channel family protein [bacterium]
MNHESLLTHFSGITTEQWLLALLALAGGWVLKQIVMSVIKRLIKLAERTQGDFDDVFLTAVRRPIGWMCFLLGLWVALTVLPLPNDPVDIDHFFFSFMKSATIFVGFWMVVRLVSGFMRSAEAKAKLNNPEVAGIIPLGRKTIVVVMWIVATLIALQNIGYSVTSLLAGIGLGGAAIALAAKDTLANFFGSIVIFVDKPFVIGDWVKVGAIEGTVEEVTLRVTRIRTFEQSLITVPNSDLTTKPIENFSRMEKRRIKFEIGVTYDTPVEKLEAAVARVRTLIAADDRLHTEPQYVFFSQFSDSSLKILVLCFTVSTDYAEYLQARHSLLMNIKREFEDLGIAFAFPTQTLYVANPLGEPTDFPPRVN